MKTLAAIRDEDLPFIGGKAAGLAHLVKAGFPVPEAAVLDTRDLARFTRGVPPPDLAALISRCIGALRGRGYAKLAVRSSALGEDSTDASFAGMFETVLNVPTHDFGAVLAALKTCAEAVNSERAVAYRKARGLPRDSTKMALLIQAMIPGDLSGVLFTLDPTRGLDSTHVLEAVAGTGEKLMAGLVNPERATYEWREEKLSGGGPTLTSDRIRAISALALSVQRDAGIPLDLEWTIQDGKIFLLQNRPITRVYFETKEDWTNANMRDGGVASSVANPFITSQYRMMMNRTMPDYFTRMRMLPKKGEKHEWARVVGGHLYWNLTATKLAVSRLPGFVEREFDEGLGITPNYDHAGARTRVTPVSLFRGVRVLSALKKSLRERPAAGLAVIAHSNRIFAELTPKVIAGLKDPALAERAETLIGVDWFMVEGGYFHHIYDNSNCRTLFMKALEKFNRRTSEKVSALDLVTGLGEIPHLAPVNELWALSRKVRADAKARDLFTKTPIRDLVASHLAGRDFPLSSELRRFVADYRYRSPRELDLRVPNWDEDPTQVYESLRTLAFLPDGADPMPAYARQTEIFRLARAKIAGGKLTRLLDQHRALLKQREDLRIHSIRTLYLVRLVFMELGRRLVARKVLKSADDLFYLEYPDAIALFRNPVRASLLGKLEKNRIYTESYRNFRKPNEIRATQNRGSPSVVKTTPAPSKSRIQVAAPLQGVPCSPGTVEGEVCVIRSVHDLCRLKPSSILVTEFVDPAWTISFLNLKGLITETGGVLSHGAVIAREYGFPAILAVPGAIGKLPNGCRVRMDGANGSISLLGGPVR